MPVEGFRGRCLIYDTLLPVLELLERDYGDLYRCSLVNRDFNEMASKVLYSRVVLSPPFRPSLDLKNRDGLSVSTPNVPFIVVLNLTVRGTWPIAIVVSTSKFEACLET